MEALDFHVVVEFVAVELEVLAVERILHAHTVSDNCIQSGVDTQSVVVVDNMVADMAVVVDYDVAVGTLVH